MSEGTTGTGTGRSTGAGPGRPTVRGNPAPRRALARVRPLPADESDASAWTPAAGVPAADHPGNAGHAGNAEDAGLAAAPGGTEGRDLLIPSRRGGPAEPADHGHRRKKRDGAAPGGKQQPTVPSLADLMPPEAPSGRRSRGAASSGAGGRSSRHGKDAEDSKDSKDARDAKLVELVVTLPKPLRKRLKERAAELGLTPEETVAQLVEVWVDG